MYSRIALAALALAWTAIFYFSDRPFGLTSTPRVAEVAVIPDGPRFADVRRYAEYGAAVLPYMSDAQRPAGGQDPTPRIGWTYREIARLRMPFWASGEFGYVAYVERPWGISITPIGEAQMALLEQRAGRAYSRRVQLSLVSPCLGVADGGGPDRLDPAMAPRGESGRGSTMGGMNGERLILHEYSASGNCYKVRLTAALLGLTLERREYDILKGETRTPQFLATVNANGRIPVLQVGDRFLPESNAACFYLADGSRARPRRPLRPGRHAALDGVRAI